MQARVLRQTKALVAGCVRQSMRTRSLSSGLIGSVQRTSLIGSANRSAGATATGSTGRDEKRHRHEHSKQDSKWFKTFASSVLAVGAVAATAASDANPFRSGSDEQQSASADAVLEAFDWFEDGVRFQTGDDETPKDVAQAVALFKRAAEAGSAPAQYNLGTLLLAGVGGLARDDKEAAKWFMRAALQEDPDSQFMLGLLYSIGRGVEGGQSVQAAMEWWQRAADQNFPPAQLRLAAAYKPKDPGAAAAPPPPSAGDRDPALTPAVAFSLPDHARSASKCLYWLLRAAKAGLPEAEVALLKHGDELSRSAGWTISTFDQLKHTPLLFGDAEAVAAAAAEAAEEAESKAAGAAVGTSATFAAVTAPTAEPAAFGLDSSPSTELHRFYQLGLMYRLSAAGSPQQQRAINYLKTAAEAGYSLAQCELAAAYAFGLVSVAGEDGKPIHSLDAKQKAANEAATLWFTRAANQGLPVAMYNLGTRQMLARNEAGAAEWFIRAAVRGNAEAQNNLGALYCRGVGVEQDEEAGVRWFAYAARRGMKEAMHALGQAYELGVGVEIDPQSAAHWYNEAASRGVAQSDEALRKLRASGVLAKATAASTVAAGSVNPAAAAVAAGGAQPKPLASPPTGPEKSLAPLNANASPKQSPAQPAGKQ